MKLNLKDLTILIPTYKRNQYLLKNLSFWEDYSTNIIILDGGKKPIKFTSTIFNNQAYMIYSILNSFMRVYIFFS